MFNIHVTFRPFKVTIISDKADEQTQDEIVALQWQLEQASHLEVTNFIAFICAINKSHYTWTLSEELYSVVTTFVQLSATPMFVCGEPHFVGTFK